MNGRVIIYEEYFMGSQLISILHENEIKFIIQNQLILCFSVIEIVIINIIFTCTFTIFHDNSRVQIFISETSARSLTFMGRSLQLF